MSIKVKHDGNSTAAAFASAQGGMGKRQQQDASALSSIMQHATNAGISQLRGASAPSATPGRSSAQLMHAPTSSPPAAPLLPSSALRNSLLRQPTAAGSSVAGSGTAGGTAGGGQPRRTSFTSMTTPQDQLAQLQLQKARDEYWDDMVVESDERFGRHSPNATWDPTNGGRWMRRYRPGEKEAEAMSRILPVQDYFKTLSDNRTLENNQALDRSKTMNEIYKYREGRRTDMATKVDVIGNKDANADVGSKVDALTKRKKELMDFLQGAANRVQRGLPANDESKPKGVAEESDPEWDIPIDDEPPQQNTDYNTDNIFD